MVDGKANIDQDTCIACGACIGECPVEAIEREEIVREVKNKEGKDLWVNVELEDGEPVGVVYELLGVGAELAAKADQKCCAVLICKEAGSLPQKLFAAGADIVYVVSGLSMQSIILIFILMLFVNWLKPINQMLFYAELL